MHQATNPTRTANNPTLQPETRTEGSLDRSAEASLSGNRLPPVTPNNAPMLQRAVGNRAVAHMLMRQASPGPAAASFPPTKPAALQRKPVPEENRDTQAADSMEMDSGISQQSEHAQPAGLTPGRPLIQRALQPFPTQYKDQAVLDKYRGPIERISQEIDRIVTQARDEAIQWHSFDGHPSPHLKNWFAIANAYLNNPETEPDLIHARFGYAIETLACQAIGDFAGLTVNMQVAEGHTRPDIVVFDGDLQVAWIDITSSQSVGHILKKDGAGWKKRPFVFEVLYDPLNPQEILEATSDGYYKEYGQFMAAEQQIEWTEKQKKQAELKNKFTTFQSNQGWKGTGGNSKNKREETQTFFLEQFPDEDEEVKTVDRFDDMSFTRGALKYLKIADGPFGFNRGGVSTSNAAVKSLIEQEAEAAIQEGQAQLAAEKNQEILQQLAPYFHIPAVASYADSLIEGLPDRERAKTGMLLKQALEDYHGLDELRDLIKQDMPQQDDWRVQQVLATIDEVQAAFPEIAIFSRLGDWRRKVKPVHKQARLVYSILEMQSVFLEYAKAKTYTMFNWPREVGRIVTTLSEFPADDRIVAAAAQWMTDNPVTTTQFQEEVKLNEEVPDTSAMGGFGGFPGFTGSHDAGGLGSLGGHVDPTLSTNPQPTYNFANFHTFGTPTAGLNNQSGSKIDEEFS